MAIVDSLSPGTLTADAPSQRAVVQDGLAKKTDLNPANAYSAVIPSADELYDDFIEVWWDAAASRIRLTDGSGGPGTGRESSGATRPSFWQMACGNNVLYEQWKRKLASGATAAANDARTKIQSNWNFVKSVFTVSDLETGNGFVAISDDAAWAANYYRQVHEATGDATALAVLAEIVPNTLNRFADPLQTKVSYGASPKGVAFSVGPKGILYAAATEYDSVYQYGYISSAFEAFLARAALYVWEANNARIGYRDYAVATFNWVKAKLRTSTASSNGAAEGIYYLGLNLDPNVAAATFTCADATITGTSLKLNQPPTGAVSIGQYLRGERLVPGTRITAGSGTDWTVSIAQSWAGALGGSLSRRAFGDPYQLYDAPQDAYFGAPIRGTSAQYDGGTAAVAILAARLYAATAQAAYLTEAQSIAAAYSLPNAFGRIVKGVPFIASLRESWTTGYPQGDFARLVLPLANVDPTGAYKIAMRNTAQLIAATASREGYLTPDWAGPEYNPFQDTSSWAEDSAKGYGPLPVGGLHPLPRS